MYAFRMMLRGRHPIHGLPFDRGDVPNRLHDEWRAMPLRARFSRLRRALQRDLLMLAIGQSGLCVERVPPGTRKVLWVYNWTTLGDAIMDLSARFAVPADIELDLCIAPALAGLFARDARFRHVYTRLDECPQDVDFVLIHEPSGRTLRAKRERLREVPFAPVLNSFIGEHFARAAFVDARLRHLFRLTPGPLPAPTLSLGESPARTDGPFDIAVVLGAGDPRRRFPHWNETLHAVLDAWPRDRPVPRFRLLGSDNARADVESLAQDVREQHGEDRVGQTSLMEAIQVVRDSDAFLGTDGGLMHVAAALGKPGLALFVEIDPGLRLPASSPLRGLLAPRTLAELNADDVARAFIDACISAPAGGLRSCER